jgi:hypothetical protein
MKAISKARIGFRNPEDGSIFPLVPNELTELPDFAEKDPMFRLALDGGVLTLIRPEGQRKGKKK